MTARAWPQPVVAPELSAGEVAEIAGLIDERIARLARVLVGLAVEPSAPVWRAAYVGAREHRVRRRIRRLDRKRVQLLASVPVDGEKRKKVAA